ncbi:type I restriction endonuclease subunit R [Brackiella oedipodis]|uniref:type I restriction endonuclease subunit R n=1 Tax=Brackiella oedipodis TaxID=124225 RepID=UPI00057116D2|nr:type I restriction endonuclease subunit R [Brackiella oedipodis]
MPNPIANHQGTIAQLDHCTVVNQFNFQRPEPRSLTYQSEAQLEQTLIEDLQRQGYELLSGIKNRKDLLQNARHQIQDLNKCVFSESEWQRFKENYLLKNGEDKRNKTRKIQEDDIYELEMDDHTHKNIYLVDKRVLANNKLQVIQQYKDGPEAKNRYDVSILVNGLPLVHIELKKRGIPIREAFNQVVRYGKESLSDAHSLYQFVQLFVISNGTDTRYFANTVKREQNTFNFAMHWADAHNTLIKDLKYFTESFFEKLSLLKVLFWFSIFDSTDNLLIMRPYQIAATEQILHKIRASYNARIHSQPEAGGYIWHATGSGKTLTSFKVARSATQLPFIDKVMFVVDRKDLDYQTIKEYQKFDYDSVKGSENTEALRRNLLDSSKRIVVTTLQKLNNLLKREEALDVYKKRVVIIFDECHRSQFGEAQKNIKKRFKCFYQFGFTGTPIFEENALYGHTTASVFGGCLHSYLITDAIRDGKVLPFKVDYNAVRPHFREIESEQDEEILKRAETKEYLLNPNRIQEISQYVLDNFRIKTHRLQVNAPRFNAMFAVSSVEAAKLYYEQLNALQVGSKNPLKIATIFSYAPNEAQDAIGDISDESFNVNAMNSTAKEFLAKAINDYNAMFNTSFAVDGQSFQNYYRDLSQRVKNKDVDLLIVVGMFLTGFDAPSLNTLFVDKNLRYHGLLQAFSRTNRIYDRTKPFGNIVCFRDLEQAAREALQLFGQVQDLSADSTRIAFIKTFREYTEGVIDPETGAKTRGLKDVVADLRQRFPEPAQLSSEKDKKAFVKLFGEYLRLTNDLQNFDEYTALQKLQQVAPDDVAAHQQIQHEFGLSDEQFSYLQSIDLPSEREIQDALSAYTDIRDWLNTYKDDDSTPETPIDWNDVEFEIELLKTLEINVDYIMELIFQRQQEYKALGMQEASAKEATIDEARRLVKSSPRYKYKEPLIVEFINQHQLTTIKDPDQMRQLYDSYETEEAKKEMAMLIESDNLNAEAVMKYIKKSLQQDQADNKGQWLDECMKDKAIPLDPDYTKKREGLRAKIQRFVDKYRGIRF